MVVATQRAAMWRTAVNWEHTQERRRGQRERSLGRREGWSAGVITSNTCRLFTTACADVSRSSPGSVQGLNRKVHVHVHCTCM